MTSHAAPVDKLLRLEDPLESSVADEPAYEGFSEKDVPALLALAGDTELLALPVPDEMAGGYENGDDSDDAEGEDEDDDSEDEPTAKVDPRVWGPAHAVRVLGKIGAVTAIPDVIALLEKHETSLLLAAAVDAFEEMGPPALDELGKVLESSEHTGQLMVVADAVAAIGSRDNASWDRAAGLLKKALARGDKLGPEANAYVISSALDLEALEATDEIEHLFDANLVDDMILTREESDSRLGRSAEGLMRLAFQCLGCGREDRRVVGHVYPHPDPATCTREGWDGLVPGRVITCHGCGAVDRYELDAVTRELLLTGAARVMSGKSQPTRILPLAIPLSTGKSGRRASEILEDRRTQVEADPDTADTWRDLAQACQLFDELGEAVEAWEEVGELDEDAFDAPFALGMLHAENEDLEDAYDYFDTSLSMLPEGKSAEKGERARILRIIAETVAQQNDYAEEPQGIRVSWRVPGSTEGTLVVDLGEIETWDEIGDFLEAGQVTALELAPEADASDLQPLAAAITLWKKRKKNPFVGRGWQGSSRKRR